MSVFCFSPAVSPSGKPIVSANAIAMMPRKNEITLLQLDGIFSTDEFQKGLELAQQGCRQLYDLQKNVIKEKYKTIRDEVALDEKKEK